EQEGMPPSPYRHLFGDGMDQGGDDRGVGRLIAGTVHNAYQGGMVGMVDVQVHPIGRKDHKNLLGTYLLQGIGEGAQYRGGLPFGLPSTNKGMGQGPGRWIPTEPIDKCDRSEEHTSELQSRENLV